LRRYKRKSVKVGVFKFRREGSVAHQPLLVSE